MSDSKTQKSLRFPIFESYSTLSLIDNFSFINNIDGKIICPKLPNYLETYDKI